MDSLDVKCVAFFRGTAGKFHTTKALSVSLLVPTDELRATLTNLYYIGMIDRYVLIVGDAATGYYGHHKGVSPGTALMNSAQEGRAA